MEESGTAAGPLAVECATEFEFTHLRTALPPGREEWHAGRFFTLTQLDDYPVVLACCGIGMLSAAAVTDSTFAPETKGQLGRRAALLTLATMSLGQKQLSTTGVCLAPSEDDLRLAIGRAGA